MKQQGHADALNTIPRPDDAIIWKEMCDKPYPKLLTGFGKAQDISLGMELGNVTKGRTEWMTQMGYTDGKQLVKGDIYIAYTSAPSSALNDDECFNSIRQFSNELIKAGCNAVPIIHTVVHDDRINVTRQYGLFHPLEQPDILRQSPPPNCTRFGRTHFISCLFASQRMCDTRRYSPSDKQFSKTV